MPRFYYPESMTVGATAVLTDHAAHHVQVLRLAHGETITLFNGEGGEYTATLTAIEKKRVQAEIKAISPRQNELPYAITLAQALPENTNIGLYHRESRRTGRVCHPAAGGAALRGAAFR